MKNLKVLVVGSGGREHALVHVLAGSPSVARVEAAPGNPGMASLARCRSVRADDLEGLQDLARTEAYDLVVIGPETPLAAGLADGLRAARIPVFGPGQKGAILEASKAYAKDFMFRHHIPTAGYRVVERPEEAEAVLEAWGAPVVVKASGLAAGKGVTVAETVEAARAAVTDCLVGGAFGEAGRTVVLERLLVGEEASLFVLTDGEHFKVLPASQDHKRAFDGDLGPNTGGMGAYSPAPMATPELLARTEEAIVRPTLAGLKEDGIPYRGVLYVGLMLTEEGPQVVEFNVRFGDPETQVVLPRMELDWGELFLQTAQGELDDAPLPPPAHPAAVCVVAATADYPRRSEKGLPIEGIKAAEARGVLVFHAGTATDAAGGLVTDGGRVLGIVARGFTLGAAVDAAYAGIDAVSFPGMRYRRDIAHRALAPKTRSTT